MVCKWQQFASSELLHKTLFWEMVIGELQKVASVVLTKFVRQSILQSPLELSQINQKL